MSAFSGQLLKHEVLQIREDHRLIVAEIGPNLARVREMVGSWARAQKRPAPDLDNLPAVVVPQAPRVAVCGMARELRSAGAAARFEKVSGPIS